MGMNKEEKDTSIIPKGPYCYGKLIRADNKPPFRRTYKSCPYNGTKKIAGVWVCWCKYLDQGGTHNETTDEEWQKLIAHFGTEEKAFDALPLFLLFDSCKECGVHECD